MRPSSHLDNFIKELSGLPLKGTSRASSFCLRSPLWARGGEEIVPMKVFSPPPPLGLLSLPGIFVKTRDQRAPLWQELPRAHATCEPFLLRCAQGPGLNHSLAVVGIYADLASRQPANLSEELIWEGEAGVERLGTGVSQRHLFAKPAPNQTVSHF